MVDIFDAAESDRLHSLLRNKAGQGEAEGLFHAHRLLMRRPNKTKFDN